MSATRVELGVGLSTYPKRERNVLGLDIGGANLKAAHTNGTARSVPFPLWREPQRLAQELEALLNSMSAFDTLAITMTGELCDCFQTKREGVEHILDAVTNAMAATDTTLRVWQTTGTFADLAIAKRHSIQTAAANWQALAVFVSRLVPEGAALLVDVGTTTTDIIPLVDGKPSPRGLTDVARMQTKELVYTGVERTPVCALLGSRVMAELFATTLDVYLLLESIPETESTNTADGRTATIPNAHARMSRMLGGDPEMCSLEETTRLARDTAAIQEAMLQEAVQTVVREMAAKPERVILSGSGEFLARKVALRRGFDEAQLVSLNDHLGSEISSAACAHAVAVLASEEKSRL
ncbi:MAG: hydantoinase/oxoprolinase family protein [Gemmataceae bacterium]